VDEILRTDNGDAFLREADRLLEDHMSATWSLRPQPTFRVHVHRTLEPPHETAGFVEIA
jgi:hypothetical protein